MDFIHWLTVSVQACTILHIEADTKWTPFADDIFKCISLNENVWIPIKISMKFVPKGPINNIPALVQIMAWRRPGDKPLSEPMMVSSTTHICVTRPQWVNLSCCCDLFIFLFYILHDTVVKFADFQQEDNAEMLFNSNCLLAIMGARINCRWIIFDI